MGSGIGYKCKRCLKKYDVSLGVGMFFPSAFKEAIKDIKKGKYGTELRTVIDSGELIVPDAARYFYCCEQCGTWEVAEDLSLYQPKSIPEIKKQQFGDKTVEEWGEIPYATRADFETDYNLVYKNPHSCRKCKKEMTRYDISQFKNDISDELPCPRCGTKNEPDSYIDWD